MNRMILTLIMMLLCASTAYSKVTYLHSNPMGSVVAATDETGKQIWVKRYTPYGIESEASGAANDGGANHGFATHETDKETGLVYMKARYYDPNIGKFMSYDPVRSGSNYFAYANNNPINWIDPNGLDALDLNLMFVSLSFGQDGLSGQFMWGVRAGFVGLGLTYDPSAAAPMMSGRDVPGECVYCSVTSVTWENINIGAGVTIGPLQWSPIQYDSDVLVDEYKYDKKVGHYEVEGDGWNFDGFNFSSVFEGGEFGINISLDANFEYGGTIDWSSFRSTFDMEPLSYEPAF